MKVPLTARKELLGRLPAVQYVKPEKADRDRFEQVNLAASLLLMAEIDQDWEADLCRSVTEHLLGQVPEPDDAELGEL